MIQPQYIQGVEITLTPEQVAELLQVPIKTIWNWASSGKLPGYKVGSKWRFRPSELEGAIKKMRPRTQEEKNRAHKLGIIEANA